MLDHYFIPCFPSLTHLSSRPKQSPHQNITPKALHVSNAATCRPVWKPNSTITQTPRQTFLPSPALSVYYHTGYTIYLLYIFSSLNQPGQSCHLHQIDQIQLYSLLSLLPHTPHGYLVSPLIKQVSVKPPRRNFSSCSQRTKKLMRPPQNSQPDNLAK